MTIWFEHKPPQDGATDRGEPSGLLLLRGPSTTMDAFLSSYNLLSDRHTRLAQGFTRQPGHDVFRTSE
jgi:hypothetical protein